MTNEQTTSQALRKTIKDGFKEYDGDIREEAIELLNKLEANYGDACAEMRRLTDEHTKLQEEFRSLQDRATKLQADLLEVAPIEYEYKKIDFGVTQLYFALPIESPLIYNDFVKELNNCAMTVPIVTIVDFLKKQNRL